MKLFTNLFTSLLFIVALMTTTKASASIADYYTIPLANASARVGALMPYVRYDSQNASLGGNASLVTSPKMAKTNIASQASDQNYVDLPSKGSYAEWTMSTTGRGVTMRFTLPDTSDGMGQKGSLDVYVNEEKVQTVTLNSYWMWQYFASGNPADSNDGGTACFAFDEVHFLLNKRITAGDKIRIQSSGANGLDYGVDFLEIEEVPDPIACPNNAVNVENYGAVANDGNDDLTAFVKAVEAADAGNKVVYIPQGTWNLSGIWNIYCSGVKITGAGIWYTNIQFTNSAAFGGGISGGNGSNGGTDGYCKNLEFCNMYINSNLRSRYNQQAVYKCFMDVFTDGSCIHDIWEEHFECGFWFGDYNGSMDYNDGVKVVNCRIRNNLADGVNFCQGTSNATVYNCSIRNNGDDGLACWNNNYMSAKDESSNVYAYNTIDFIWRAGGIAIYGGNNIKVYNNYIRDMFMAAGIHLNTTFDGYKFQNTTSIQFDNNILVHCGTNSDSWGEDLAAIDLKQDVKNVTFNNTQIYNSPFDAIRCLTGPSSVNFNNTTILGTGLTQEPISYSCVAHTCGAIRYQNENVKFSGLQIGGYKSDLIGNNTTFPIWSDNSESMASGIGSNLLGSDITYTIVDYPTPDNTQQGGGVVDPLNGINGYDVELAGLAWKNASGSTTLTDGDKVTFTAAIRNKTSVDIPEKVKIVLQVVIDDTTNLTLTYTGGLKAGSVVKLAPTTWTATVGGHKAVATVDPNDVLSAETDETNNSRIKSFNVTASSAVPNYMAVTGGYDLQILKITYGQDKIDVNDNLVFSALVVNAGDTDIPAGSKIGIQFQVDGATYGTGHITWCDNYTSGLNSHATATLTCNGGGGSEGDTANYWTTTSGYHSIVGWIDDTNNWSEVNENNNKTTLNISVPYGGITYVVSPDSPDDLDNLDATTPEETTVSITTSKAMVSYCSDQTLDFSNVNGLKAYIASGYIISSIGFKVKLKEIDIAPAGTGLILIGTAGTTYKVAKSSSGGFYSNLLVGVMTTETIDEINGSYTNYVLQNQKFLLANKNPIASGKAYLQIPTSATGSAKQISIIFEDGTTGICNVENSYKLSTPKPIYTLSGIKVAQGTKLHSGLYICNGKVFIIK
jgi:hypothetical protein